MVGGVLHLPDDVVAFVLEAARCHCRQERENGGRPLQRGLASAVNGFDGERCPVGSVGDPAPTKFQMALAGAGSFGPTRCARAVAAMSFGRISSAMYRLKTMVRRTSPLVGA